MSVRKLLKFFLLSLTLLSGVLSAHANSANQIAPSAEDAEPIQAGRLPLTLTCAIWTASR
jgi:hypothetical protein